jgi:hypothetical protein
MLLLLLLLFLQLQTLPSTQSTVVSKKFTLSMGACREQKLKTRQFYRTSRLRDETQSPGVFSERRCREFLSNACSIRMKIFDILRGRLQIDRRVWDAHLVTSATHTIYSTLTPHSEKSDIAANITRFSKDFLLLFTLNTPHVWMWLPQQNVRLPQQTKP